MIRPTMSHAVNAEHLAELKEDYTKFLEQEVQRLTLEVNELKASAPLKTTAEETR